MTQHFSIMPLRLCGAEALAHTRSTDFVRPIAIEFTLHCNCIQADSGTRNCFDSSFFFAADEIKEKKLSIASAEKNEVKILSAIFAVASRFSKELSNFANCQKDRVYILTSTH